mmetsp:Transcript_53047/g.113951  ORF Transcript_53047/g.113951 Transcript_53047/m.113951 type:complete len:389 (+) Transcript_53047:1238-2404(+)
MLVGSCAVALEVRHLTLGGAVLAVEVPHVSCQCTLVVKEENPVLGVAVSGEDNIERQLRKVLSYADVANLCAEADALDANALLLPRPAQVAQEVLEPLHWLLLLGVEVVGVVSRCLLFLRHGHHLFACGDEVASVPGVDAQGSHQHPAASRELAHQDHAVFICIVIVRGDEFERHQVQARLHARVEQHVSRAEEGKAVRSLDLRVDANADVAVAWIDCLTIASTNELHAEVGAILDERIRFGAQRLPENGGILVGHLRREAILDQHDLPLQVRVLRQEPLECPELGQETTQVVATIHAREDGLPLEEGPHLGRLALDDVAIDELLRILIRVRVVRNLDHNRSTIVLDCHEATWTECGVEPVDPLDADEKISSVREELEAQHVGTQETR